MPDKLDQLRRTRGLILAQAEEVRQRLERVATKVAAPSAEEAKAERTEVSAGSHDGPAG
jgi:uncharacterized membrane protein